MMHVSLLPEYVISMGHVEERTTSNEGTSVPYVYTWGQMAHAGNDVLIIFQFSHNTFNLYFRIGSYHSNLLHGTTQVITSVLFALLRLRAINNGERETVRIQLHER